MRYSSCARLGCEGTLVLGLLLVACQAASVEDGDATDEAVTLSGFSLETDPTTKKVDLAVPTDARASSYLKAKETASAGAIRLLRENPKLAGNVDVSAPGLKESRMISVVQASSGYDMHRDAVDGSPAITVTAEDRSTVHSDGQTWDGAAVDAYANVTSVIDWYRTKHAWTNFDQPQDAGITVGR